MRPGTHITATQLQAEVDEFGSLAEAEANSIAQQQIMREYIFNAAINTATAGSFNWLQFLTGAGSLIGVGAFADNVRFRIKYKKQT